MYSLAGFLNLDQQTIKCVMTYCNNEHWRDRSVPILVKGQHRSIAWHYY